MPMAAPRPVPLALLALLVLLQGAAPQRSVGPHAGSAAPSPPDSDWQEQDYKVHSQLHDDALAGNETAVAELLAAGDMNINRQRGSAYNTPLHNAAHAGHLGVAKLLLEVGAAPISKTDADGVMHVRIGQEFAKIDAQVIPREAARDRNVARKWPAPNSAPAAAEQHQCDAAHVRRRDGPRGDDALPAEPERLRHQPNPQR